MLMTENDRRLRSATRLARSDSFGVTSLLVLAWSDTKESGRMERSSAT